MQKSKRRKGKLGNVNEHRVFQLEIRVNSRYLSTSSEITGSK